MVGNNAWQREVRAWIQRNFPNITVSDYKLTSPDTIDYNCVAWAAEDEERWWWPDAQNESYWPFNISREETLEAFIQAFQTIGYEVCEVDTLEQGFQKIAIYTDANGVPKHVARQLPNGKWTSKLGSNEDIEHNNLQVLTGKPGYGEVTCFMKKSVTKQ